MMEVATGVAHPPSGLHHNNKIPPDYTRVEVHTVKPEFMQWRIVKGPRMPPRGG